MLDFIAMPLWQSTDYSNFVNNQGKQPDSQGAWIDISTINDTKIWDTYIKKISKCNCAKFTHSPLFPVSMLLY